MRYNAVVLLFILISLGFYGCSKDENADNIGCLSNNDCPVGNICSNSECVPGITDNSDGDQEEEKVWCGECCYDEDCGLGYICTDNLCVKDETPDGDTIEPTCTTDTQCAPGQSCVNGQCVFGDPDGDTDGDTVVDGDIEPQNCTTAADCSDFLYCNGTETCSAEGQCQPGVNPCDDGQDCTTDSCDEELNHCDNISDHSQCDDGIECTSDVCVSASGCVNTVNDMACTVDELCDPESDLADETTGCKPKPQCESDSDCDDELWCNGIEKCVDTICQPGEAVDCNDDITCTEDICDEENETCNNTPTDSLCQDEDLCNGEEICDPDSAEADAAGCIAGTEPDCNDSVDCTVDSCIAATGCENVPDNDACEGDNVCHAEQGCIGPECVVNADCSDSSVCTGEEVCNMGLCEDGTDLDCDVNLSGQHDTATCHTSNGCEYACEDNYLDCNADLGSASGNGCEMAIQTVGFGETGAKKNQDSCTLGVAAWHDYSGCDGYTTSGKEVLYKFVATQSGEMVAGVQSTDYDVDVYVLSNPCNKDSCYANGSEEGDDYAIFDAVAGNTYYIVVDGYDGDGLPVCGKFDIGVDLRENTDCESTGNSQAATVILTLLALIGWMLMKRRKENRI